MQLKSPQVWSSASLFQLTPSSIQDQTKSTTPAANPVLAPPKPPDTSAQASSAAQVANPAKTTPKPSLLKRTNAIRNKTAKNSTSSTSTAPTIAFPLDYFEKCTQVTDIEYGGNDLLEVYNTQQLKSRLGLGENKFVVSTRNQGYRLEISNSSESSRALLMGCRILCGTHSVEKAPTYFEVFERRVPVKLVRPRWVDVCLTREEALIAVNKLSVFVGASNDALNVTIIEACLCYGKTKEQLNWSKTEAQLLQKRYQSKLSASKLASAEEP
jgi:hypothetical protein